MHILKFVEDEEEKKEEGKGELDHLPKKLWGRLLLLPSERAWYGCNIILCYFSVLGNIYLSVNGKCLSVYREYNFIVMFYAMDGIALMGTILQGLSMIFLTSKTSDQKLAARPIWVLIIEIISILPIEQAVTYDDNLFCVFRLNRSLKIALICYYNAKRNWQIDSTWINKLIEFISILVFLTAMIYGVYCNLLCFKGDECADQFCDGKDYLAAITSAVTCTGYLNLPQDNYFQILCIVVQMFVYYYICSSAIAHCTVTQVSDYRNQISYTSCCLALIETLKRNKAPKHLVARVNKEFHLIWNMKRNKCFNLVWEGFGTGQSFLHPSMYNELQIDIAWTAFKHSHLFRDMHVHYLRYIADYVQLEFRLPGEYLYVKGQWKNKMIYIFSGTIEILSNEDEQTSILSLCEGTCIGEASLLLSYKSSHYIRCKTFCEVHVLRKRDFLRSQKFFSQEHKVAKKVIFGRFRETVTLHESSTNTKSSLERCRGNVDSYTLLWIKNTLHRLMCVDADSTFRHEFQNIYLMNEVKSSEFKKLHFHAEYLDMFVVRERMEVEEDSVFVSAKFPFLFLPNSIICILWHSYIMANTFFLAIVLPLFAFLIVDTPNWYFTFETVVNHLFVLDVIIALSTAVRERHGVTLNLKSTAKARLHTVELWVDIIACVPMEMFLCIITKSSSTQHHCQVQLNRLLKLWTINTIITGWEAQFNTNKLIIRYIKYLIGLSYTIFLCFCVIGYFIPANDRIALLFEAVQRITNTNVYGIYSPPDLFTTLSNFVCISLYVVFTSNIISGYIMVSLPRFQAQDICSCVFNLLKSNHMLTKYDKRIMKIIEIEWIDNKCNRLKGKEQVSCEMPKKSYQDYMMHNVGDILKSLRCFQSLPDDLIYDVCGILTQVIIPPNEAIVYSGDLTCMVSIVYKGYFNIFDGYGRTIKTVNTPTAVNLIEAYMKIPTVHTHVTVTHCKSLNFNIQKLRSIANKYCHSTVDVYSVLGKCVDIKTALQNLVDDNEYYPDLSDVTDQENFFTVPWHLPADSYAEYDYHVPFDRLFMFSFIKYLLMRTTIHPEGSFMFYWELNRCVCALLSCVLFYLVPLVMSPISNVLLVLDFLALADIYVRLHIAYYNDDGILISHPLFTAKNYLTGAFVVDVIGMLPTTRMVTPTASLLAFFAHSNKLLQMYRFTAFFMIYYAEKITMAQQSNGLTFIPYVAVLSCYSSYYIMLLECDVTENISSFAEGSLICHQDSIFDSSNLSRTPNPVVAQSFSIYITTSIVTCTGMQGFNLSDNIRGLVMIFTVVGVTLCISFAGRFVTLYSFTHTTLLKYQNLMTSLSAYLNNLKVKQSLQKLILDNYGMKWSVLKSRGSHQMLGRFSIPLQYDVMYNLYGKHLNHTSVFKNKKQSFYRNLVHLMTYEAVVKGSYIGRVNDITPNIHILYSGSIDVISYDGIVLDNLGPGSIFGNMENKKLVRLTVMYEVRTHVVCLSVPAVEFYRILKHYPDIENEFLYLRSKHRKYIHKDDKEHESLLISETTVRATMKPQKNQFTFKPNTKAMLLWETFVLLYPGFIGLILEAYQSAVQEYSLYMISILYLGDLIYMVHYIIKERTGYIDRSGALVKDFALVRQRFRKNRFMFIMTVISVLPIDIPILILNMKESAKYLIYGLARFNRFCRLTHLFEYFSPKNHLYNRSIYWMKVIYVMMWSFLALNGIATLILLVASIKCCDDANMHPHVPCFETMYRLTPHEKFDIYILYLNLAANLMNFTSQPNIYPIAFLEILVFVVIMWISQHLSFLCYSQMYALLFQCFQTRLYYRDTLSRLNNFMHREDVSTALFDRVMSYVKRRWQRRGNDVYPVLMEEAPTYIQETILTSVFGYIITNHVIFNGCQKDFLRQVIQKVRSRVFFKGDYIQFEGVIDKCMYFIHKGEVTVYKEDRNIDVVQEVLQTGNSFGILAGLNEAKKHEYTYMATTNCIVLILNFEVWKHLLEFFPFDHQSILAASHELMGNK